MSKCENCETKPCLNNPYNEDSECWKPDQTLLILLQRGAVKTMNALTGHSLENQSREVRDESPRS